MRAGLSTIQQTLTPEAATVLNQSIAEATRRNHGQTTPLHVAATLLSPPSGYLRQACIRSHPNSSHPLQCRALELCFSVALDRLPSSQTQNNSSSPGFEPPISNALMAALKRAQAHQRRGCPEQQQQPLLAVKVELEQLIVSILDDPSVSRVMREASFSSPAVKASIEQSLNSSHSSSSVIKSSSIGSGLGFRPAPMANRNLYMNPKLQNQGNYDQSGCQRKEEVKKVLDVLLKTKKRNPVLVGDLEPARVIKELLQKIEKKELGESSLSNVQVVPLDKEFTSDRTKISEKVKDLGDLIESRNNGGGGVILNLGDLKWLVEQNIGIGGLGSNLIQQQQMVSEMGRMVVVEIGKLLGRFGESNGKLWLVGTATCETYLRCQVYHPSMENDWDLQAIPIATKNPPPGLFSRFGGNGILSSSVKSLSPLKAFPIAGPALSQRPFENMDLSRKTGCCPQCTEKYEQEIAKLEKTEAEKSSSDSKQESVRQILPPWLQNAKPKVDNLKITDHMQDQDTGLEQKRKEIQKKWSDTCSRLHPSYLRSDTTSGRNGPIHMPPMTNLYKSNPLNHKLLQPNIQKSKNLGGTLEMNPSLSLNRLERRTSPPGSPVRTELALGRPKIPENTLEKAHIERVQDFAGYIPSDGQSFEVNRQKLVSKFDPDSFKSLFKGLLEKVWWQPDAVSAVASSVIACKSGNGKRRGVGSMGDSWMLFAGPDKVGKKKMASALSELVGRARPITIRLGSRSNEDDDEESGMRFRGKTTLDQIAEAVRRNPFSVIVLEDIDRADMLVHGSIKRAIDRGRLPDSHGREVSLGNVIFILTADWVPENVKNLSDSISLYEHKLSSLARNEWVLQLSVSGKTGKRRLNWFSDENRTTKPRTEAGSALSFDLNEAAETEDDLAEGSRNSSGVTVEHEQEQNLVKNNHIQVLTTSTVDLFNSVDEEIIFKPVDFTPIRTKVASTITSRFSSTLGDGLSIKVDEEALEQIVSGVWFGQTSFEDWVEKILVPSFQQLKSKLGCSDENVTVKLDSVRGSSERRSNGDLLPSKVTVVVE